MADRKSPSPEGRTGRQRAPTITIDTSAVNNPDMGNAVPLGNLSDSIHTVQTQRSETSFSTQSQSRSSPVDPRNPNSFDSNQDRPTSPHNVSSPSNRWNDPNAFLSVPNGRSRGNSLDSQTETGQGSVSGTTETYVNSSPTGGNKQQLGPEEILNDKDALKPDPGTEDTFEVEDNKFAFSPGQLSKLYNPKSLGAFHALGGLEGLIKGLRTDRKSGLSLDEESLHGYVSFEEATTPSATESDHKAAHNLERADTTHSQKHGTRPTAYADRKRVYSDNRLPEKKPKSILQLAWMAYNDKVLILLTIAAVISLALGLYETFGQSHEDGEPKVEWVEGVAIMVAIFIVVVVGAVNDWQKERQFVKLNKKKSDRLVKLIRSGKTREVSVYDVLVGDIMLLEPGDMVPVDGIFIEGHNVKCDESSATGESDLLKKTPADEVYRAMEAGHSIRKMDPFILSGAKVSEGVGSFVVTATGIHSSYGKTMMALREDGEVTPLQSKLNVLAEYIAKLGGGAALLLFIVLLIEFLVHLKGSDATPEEKGQNFLDILIVAITVIVVAVPEGLPLAVTLALAFATTRMLKDNNLVRLLRSCETMGNATTVCSDKTGTLTQNKMTVVAGSLSTALRFGDRKVKNSEDPDSPNKGKQTSEDNGDDVSPSEFVSNLGDELKDLFKQSIVINSTAFEGEEDGKPAFIGSKTETALLNFARDYLGMGPVTTERSNANVVQFVPFDSGRKCMAAVVKLEDGRYRMYVKGASEILLAKASTIVDGTKELSIRPMSSDMRETLNHLIETYASRSLRTIGFLYKDFESWPPKSARAMEDDPSQANFDDIFNEMVFLGLVGIQDPLRDGVREAVQDCKKAGVFVRMVTGDNVMTAKAIAEDCGILVPGGLVMEGPKFRQLKKREMDQVIPKLCVLARSSPEDKRILVKRLKELGETVAVTGDGTNDAPALKTADIGFSMGIAGTEVAKEASAIILMDDNFSSIVKALLWGRAVNDAVKKFLQFQLTVNVTAVLLTFVSAVASSDQTSVLTAVQLLWVNLIMDTFAALALATDPPTLSLLDRKPDPKSAPLITVTMWKMIIGQAIYQLVVTFILYFAGASILGYDGDTELDQLDTLVFNTFVWMQIFNQINNRRLDNKFNIFENIHRNYFFIFINCVMIGGQVMIIFVGGAAFAVTRLNGSQWGISIVLGFLSLPVGVIIRLIPDELVSKCIPARFKRKPTPDLVLSDDYEWNQSLLEIRDELAFIKRIRGGRLGALKFKLQHPRETAREAFSRSRSSHSLPQTPNNERSDGEGGGSPAPPTSTTMNNLSSLHYFLLLTTLLTQLPLFQSSYHEYQDALSKSILFFEGQRSGYLPQDQRVTWRANSGLSDGWTYNTDLTGGYYDAGDNVKFGFPMAFTTTMLSWSVIEFGDLMPPNELRNSLVAIRWATDYLLKTVSQPNRIFVQVGDPKGDHNCWERPEDMDTPRTVYAVDAPNPASDVAGETAAALAASSMAFRSSDPGYAETLLRNAIKAFQFADSYRGAYSDNSNIKDGACPFYCDFDGYQDELLWGAAWLRRASSDDTYLSYLQNNGKTLGADDNINEFGWDNKHAGLNVLVSKEVLEGNMYSLQSYKASADSFMCTLIPESSSSHIEYTPGGLIYKPGGSNLQHATTISFLLLAYANYLERTSQSVNCGNVNVAPYSLRQQAKRQVDYILGDNPMGLSYMVGYSAHYPQRIHHRGSSLPSVKDHPEFIACKEGSVYYNSSNPNPNVHVGAIVGGPSQDDSYDDNRDDFRKSEPTTYINAPFVGVLAYFAANPNFS